MITTTSVHMEIKERYRHSSVEKSVFSRALVIQLHRLNFHSLLYISIFCVNCISILNSLLASGEVCPLMDNLCEPLPLALGELPRSEA